MKNEAAKTKLLVEGFASKKILVVGDLMLDRYIHGYANRISPEAPVPVVRVIDEINTPGGAANVARNIRSLGARAVISGIIGGDRAGRDLMDVLESESVSTDGIMIAPGLRTTVKTRVLAGRQQVVRVDRDEPIDLESDGWDAFYKRMLSVLDDVDGVVVEDYGRGAVRQDVLKMVLERAERRGIPVALDPKENCDLNVKGITVATPNRREAFVLAGVVEREPHEDPLKDVPLLRAVDVLMNEWKPRFLIVTLGAQGMLLISDGGGARHIGTLAREVFDVSGAGDTVVAVVILGLVCGGGLDDIAHLANRAAGVVVGKVGTAGCTISELLEFDAS